MTVSATDRKAGARVCAAATGWGGGCDGELVDLRPGRASASAGAADVADGAAAAAAGAWALALAGLGAAVEEGPAMGEGEVVDTCACGSFAGTLSTSDVCVWGGEIAAAVDVDVCGGDCCAAGTFSLIFPFDGRCESLGTYCGTA